MPLAPREESALRKELMALRKRRRHEPDATHAVSFRLLGRHARRFAASGPDGGGRRQDRQRQCGGGILLRSIAAAIAEAFAAGAGAVRQSAAGADRAGA